MESKIKNSRLPPLTLIVPILINNDNIAQIKPLNMHLKNEYYIQLKMPYTNTCILGVVMLSNFSNQYDIDICTRWKSNVQRWSPTTKDKYYGSLFLQAGRMNKLSKKRRGICGLKRYGFLVKMQKGEMFVTFRFTIATPKKVRELTQTVNGFQIFLNLLIIICQMQLIAFFAYFVTSIHRRKHWPF